MGALSGLSAARLLDAVADEACVLGFSIGVVGFSIGVVGFLIGVAAASRRRLLEQECTML